MLGEHTVYHKSEVIRAILLEDSPTCPRHISRLLCSLS